MRLISSFLDEVGSSELPWQAPSVQRRGQDPLKAAVEDDRSADDDQIAVAEDDDSGAASKVHEAIGRAKAVLRALGPVAAESTATQSQLADVGAQVHLAATRRFFSPLGHLAPAPAAHAAPLGAELRRLEVARLALSDDNRFGPPVSEPFSERSALGRLTAASDRVTTELTHLAGPARAALGLIEDAFGRAQEASQAQPIAEAQMLASENSTGGAEETSAGCHCDSSSRCELGGQSFAWCRVQQPGLPGTSCAVSAEIAKDPLGARSHRLGEFDGHWDYCVPHPALVAEAAAHPGVSKTAHFNCRCAPRQDILQRYADEQGESLDAVDPKLVPQSDRLSVEAMQRQRRAGGDLCGGTPSSGGFAAY